MGAVPARLVDPNKAIMLGSTTAQVEATSGTRAGWPVTGHHHRADGAPVPVTLKIDSSTATSLDGLKRMPVGAVRQAPLGDVADVSQVESHQGSVDQGGRRTCGDHQR